MCDDIFRHVLTFVEYTANKSRMLSTDYLIGKKISSFCCTEMSSSSDAVVAFG